MDINQELSLTTELPLQSVQVWETHWELNEHAGLTLTGILENGCGEDVWRQNYIGTEITVSMADTVETDGDGVLFRGLIREASLIRDCGVAMARVEAVSASVKLDENGQKQCRSFQNASLSYSDVARQMADAGHGKVICTTEKQKIGKPLICYQETIWGFLKRIASYQNSFLIPDLKTGRPNLWLGMRSGKQIGTDLNDSQTEVVIKKQYTQKGKGKAVKTVGLESRTPYSLGDWMLWQGEKVVICKAKAQFKQGELTFSYGLSAERDMRTEAFYNEELTGLSLWGTVKEAKEEKVRIMFDIDGEEGDWFYPWRPETGNALYAMPEIGARTAVYFMNHEEGSGTAIRCSGKPPENREPGDKSAATPEEGKAELLTGSLNIIKETNKMELMDSSSINLGGGQIEIEGNGKVKMRAKRISLSAASEIKATTE